MDKAAVEREGQERGNPKGVLTDVDSFLAQTELLILRKINQLKVRASLLEALKHVCCGGTGLMYVGTSGLRFYGLRSIVGDRDADDNLIEIIIKRRLSERYLPKAAQRISRRSSSSDNGIVETHDLYTYIQYDPKRTDQAVRWHQEYNDNVLPGSAGFSSMENSPWIPIRFNKVSGSFYGTGLVEELEGDLTSYNQFSKAIVQAGLGAAKTLFLVNPNGVTRPDALNAANNFDFVSGDPKDVAALTVDKQGDYQTAFTVMQAIERRLNFSFLVTQAIQREAERVTAEELKIMVNMLEESFGGVYTLLSDELQLPLIRRIMHMMKVSGELIEIPRGLVEPQITAGADAIGRGSDKQRLGAFFGFVQSAYGPDALAKYTNPLEGIRRAAAADGVATKNLVVSDEQLKAQSGQEQQLQLASQLAQSGANVAVPPPAAQAAQSASTGTRAPAEPAIA